MNVKKHPMDVVPNRTYHDATDMTIKPNTIKPNDTKHQFHIDKGSTIQSMYFLTAILFTATLACSSTDSHDDQESDSTGSRDSSTDAQWYNSDDSDNPNIDTSGEDTWLDTELPPWEAPVFVADDLPTEFPTVDIEIDPAALVRLDADPFFGPDEIGTFIDSDGQRYTMVDINYRGAYQLMNLITHHDLRNWKVKFPKDMKYRNRREWNFNWEPHHRQKMAYDLFRFAGVRVPSTQHVRLRVNGQEQGMYLQYEDPDNKTWLWDMFGHDDGDLYKAAYDIPPLQEWEKCFATFEYLGDDYTSANNDYMCHYNKKTNHKIAPSDYTAIGEFIIGLNDVSSSNLKEWLLEHFDVDSFLSYLVVSNFISNWDSYPQRPKNFWMYENLRTHQMVFIPWDLDSTFQTWVDQWNQMGPNASIFFELENHDYDEHHTTEGVDRPLARRIIGIPEFRIAYIERYRELVNTLLTPDYLRNRLTALNHLVSDNISARDADALEDANNDMEAFFTDRYQSVTEQLNALP